MTNGDGLAQLQEIRHIVVLMMENRSFDHMLGHLSLEGMADLNGLTGQEFNLDRDGNRIAVTPFDADAHAVQRHGEALQKKLDPAHSKSAVRTQLGKGYGDFSNGGFVKSFIESRKPQDNVGPDLWMVPMGYYTGKDLPVYDYLARQFCVCDAWHASVPGDTWPNRLYALAGREAQRSHRSLLERLADLIGRHALKALKDAPIFEVEAFTRHLEDAQWRWYSHDPATLRAVDERYRDPGEIKRDNFAYYDRKKVSFVTEAAEALIVGHDSFLDAAAKGELRDVTWIDPNFIDLSVLETNSNDDHPPSDVRAGQALVLEIYEALRRSPAWEDTLLVIVYDEHGGFYDHQPPPAIDDDSGYATLGVRVPALVVGPRVKQFVCHQQFDHTTLIKTILTRFAADPDRAIGQMSQRVRNADHLGLVLADAPRTDVPVPTQARAAIDDWRTAARAIREATPGGEPSIAADGAGQPLVLHEFQQEFAKFVQAVRHVLPPGQP